MSAMTTTTMKALKERSGYSLSPTERDAARSAAQNCNDVQDLPRPDGCDAVPGDLGHQSSPSQILLILGPAYRSPERPQTPFRTAELWVCLHPNDGFDTHPTEWSMRRYPLPFLETPTPDPSKRFPECGTDFTKIYSIVPSCRSPPPVMADTRTHPKNLLSPPQLLPPILYCGEKTYSPPKS